MHLGRKKVVVFGGGTGSFVTLSGLKKFPNLDLTAVVSMADDGGSTGILRDEYGILPPGDIRQCLVALSECDDDIRELFNFRFSKGGLKGHNFGNLFIGAAEQINGDFERAVEFACRVLRVRGSVLPVTLDDIKLRMRLNDGTVLVGENKISRSQNIFSVGVDSLFFDKKARLNGKVLKAIKSADLIVVCSGNFYSSILPVFLVDKIVSACAASRAKKVFVCNLMNKVGQTDNFSEEIYIKEMTRLVGEIPFDFVVCNNGSPNPGLIKKYREEGIPVKSSVKSGRRKYKLVKSNLLSRRLYKQKRGDLIRRTLVRHDPIKLAKVLVSLI